MTHVISTAAVVKIEDIPSEWNQPVCEEGLQAASSTMNIPLEQLTSTVALELPDTRQCWAYRSVAGLINLLSASFAASTGRVMERTIRARRRNR